MDPLGAVRTAGRRYWKPTLVVVLVAAVVASAGTALYFSQGFHGNAASIEQVRANENVNVERANGGYVLSPAANPPTTAIVFYPGARVEPDAYLATFAPVVERSSVTVYVPDMPLNVGLLGVGTAGEIQRSSPAVERWYVGGHSLGGVAACRYASNNPDGVDGLVLLASYCDQDVSDSGLAALSVTGSRDTVLEQQAHADARSRLPADARYHVIEGANHSQFGSYRGQRGDRRATISYEEAHDRIATVVVEWLANGTEASGL